MCKLWVNFQNKEEKSCDNSDTKIAGKHTRSDAEGFIPEVPLSFWECQTVTKQSFHKVSLWGLIFSSYIPKEVSDTVINYTSLESLHTKHMQPWKARASSVKNLFLTHCQVSAKWASLWWHQVLQCSYLPVLLVPPSSPPVQKHPNNFFLPISSVPSVSGLLAAERYHLGRKLPAHSTLLYHVCDTQPIPTWPS